MESAPKTDNIDFDLWMSKLVLVFNKRETEIYLEPLSAVPTNLREGLLVCADNANWDPNAVAGTDPYLTFYDGSAWNAVS